ncbi:uncharacterized protein LOC111041441 [Myzus persicae]|uniref:uncharacterized protein LOC111041441 n=1 Tax=Myzus persicae TaxID=13164 RepID=UPI000B938A6F|nr:uncharacterized protein LOC111041441 [Myzus persicae]
MTLNMEPGVTNSYVEKYCDMVELNNLPTVQKMEKDDSGLTELVVKAKRKLKYEEGDEHEWLKNKNKILRMQGQAYKGLRKNEMGKFSFTESRSSRQLGKICELY